MVSCKLDKYDRMFIAFILFILVIFNVCSCFAIENISDFDVISNLNIQVIDSNTVKFVNSGYASNIYYTYLKKGHSYKCIINRDFWESDNPTFTTRFYVLNSESIPSAGNNANIISFDTLESTDNSITLDFYVSNDSYYYFVICGNGAYYDHFNTNNFQLTDISSGQVEAIDGLVNDVGFNQLWSVFESGIDFIGVVVLVAFGVFLIVLLIKKLSKGKSDY